jgi:CRP-like cAMP-binding protein
VNTPSLSTLLGRTWFAEDLPPAALARLAALGELIDIPKGSLVVQEGSVCRSLGVLIKGRIALRLWHPGIADRTILTIEAGDVYGWSAVLSPSIATSTGVATNHAQAVVFDGERLLAALTADCELGAVVYRRLLVGVARRLVATRLQLLDIYRGPDPW